MPRAEHCEGGRGKGGGRYASAGVSISRELVCLLVRRSLLSLGPGAEGRSHYLGGGSLYGCPPELSFEQRMRREHEFKGGSADLVRDHASRLRIRII
eukprot:scaffold8345_cov121-Isochrysis_galbana.AAC.2